MDTPLDLLFPRPQQLATTGASLTLPNEPLIYLASAAPRIQLSARRLERGLTQHGLVPQIITSPAARGADITLQVQPALLPQAQGHRLAIDREGITIIGADEAALFYGVTTLNQLFRLFNPTAVGRRLTLPGLLITDWPDFAQRGVMLDVSRDRVPTMQTLYDLIDLLADWKINQLQLYIEHTFAYRGHQVVWEKSSPFSAQEIRALDAFCSERFIELVPNQNSFGHMHRWLMDERYRHLAECPDGFEHPWNPTRQPYGLCPIDPGSLELLADLYDQLLPNFTSRQFNVGLDETIDLGYCRSAQVCLEKGTERVYLEFLNKIHRLVTERGRTMQFWGDIIQHESQLIRELPKDAIALEWGYEADHPFAEHVRAFAESGLSFYVCPGTSSWNSLAGRTRNALGNLASAAVSGKSTGALGYLNTDWGDNGHMQPLPVSYLGLLVGGGFSWNSAEAADPEKLNVPALLDAHAFRDAAGVMGRLAYDLGNAYLATGAHVHNNSVLFLLLIRGEQTLPHPGMEGLSIDGLEQASDYIKQTIAPLTTARMDRPDADLIADEYRWVADMLLLGCDLGIARLQAGPNQPISAIPKDTRASLERQFRPLLERYRALWLRRSRPGGLDDSAARLEKTLALLAA